MAKNGAKGAGRVAAITDRAAVLRPPSGTWTKRDAVRGRFAVTKKAGGDFKGVRRES